MRTLARPRCAFSGLVPRMYHDGVATVRNRPGITA